MTKWAFLWFLICFFIFRKPKFLLAGNIVLPGRTFLLHGSSGRLVARSTSVKKALLTYRLHSLQLLIAARNRVNMSECFFHIQMFFKVKKLRQSFLPKYWCCWDKNYYRFCLNLSQMAILPPPPRPTALGPQQWWLWWYQLCMTGDLGLSK